MDDAIQLADEGTPLPAARFLVALERLSDDGWLRAYKRWDQLDADAVTHERWMTASRIVHRLAQHLDRAAASDSVGKKAFGLAFGAAMRALHWQEGANGPATDFALWVWSAASAASVADRLTADVIEISHAPFAGVLVPPVAGVPGTTLPT